MIWTRATSAQRYSVEYSDTCTGGNSDARTGNSAIPFFIYKEGISWGRPASNSDLDANRQNIIHKFLYRKAGLLIFASTSQQQDCLPTIPAFNRTGLCCATSCSDWNFLKNQWRSRGLHLEYRIVWPCLRFPEFAMNRQPMLKEQTELSINRALWKIWFSTFYFHHVWRTPGK